MMAGTYTVWVSNAGGSVNSGATLVVTPVTVAPPVILSGPKSQTVVVGSDMSFTVEASGQALSYQWQHNGSDLAGATDNTVLLTDLPLSAAGTYTVLVSNAGGSSSAEANLNVTTGSTVAPPTILAGPQSQSVAAGSDVNFTVLASGSGPLSVSMAA